MCTPSLPIKGRSTRPVYIRRNLRWHGRVNPEAPLVAVVEEEEELLAPARPGRRHVAEPDPPRRPRAPVGAENSGPRSGPSCEIMPLMIVYLCLLPGLL